MNTETLLPPMREWLFTRRLSSRFYALVLAGAGAAAAGSFPACSLDSLAPMLDSSGTVECVVDGGSDTLFVRPDQDLIGWSYYLTGAEWVTSGRLVWGIHQDARLYPVRRMIRDDLYTEEPDDLDPEGVE